MAVEYLHTNGMVHRDVHPSRLQRYGGVMKFNPIGMPYNFKKLIKRDNFSGHLNYSAPELIRELPQFTAKVDVWSLGCCFFFILKKKDPFEGSNPTEIKQNVF